MKRVVLLLLFNLILISAYSQKFTKYVNPFIGTLQHGHTFPGATYPFGMIQLSPDTREANWDGSSGYHYSDTLIYGFSHTHLSGTGVPDLCDILLMPVRSLNIASNLKPEEYRSEFSHKDEIAFPGYYEVYLKRWGVRASLSVTKRGAIHNYIFKDIDIKDKPAIVLDLTHRDKLIDYKIEQSTKNSISGYRHSSSWANDQRLYYYIEFSSNIELSILDGKKALIFPTVSINNRDLLVVVKVGISSVSVENAKQNLLHDIIDFNLTKVKNNTQQAWENFLGKIEIEPSGDIAEIESQKIVFYTALYHTAIHPSLYSDYNGEYRGLDKIVHKAIGYERYNVFSLWDTFRALHPLMSIIETKRSNDFVQSMLDIFKESGKLPIWELSGCETDCMIGYHSVSVIADAILKGIGSFDKEFALNAMIASANKKEYGKDVYIKRGYLPADQEHESVSKTLEYAYDDWCIAQVAKSLGKRDIYNEFIERAQYYKNVFDPFTGFMRPKSNSSWIIPFKPNEVNNHFTEANSWQYSFFVPQDINTHIDLLGGDKQYITKLDSLFCESNKTSGRTQVDITGLIGQYAHGNEPSHHVAYLYSYAGKPWKTAKMVREILETQYSTKPDGLCGNDDCGQMSAWYVMSALGFYQVTPADSIYVLGSPLYKKAIINLESGKKFKILSPNSSKKSLYIQSAKLNSQKYQKSYINYSNLTLGSTLELEIDSTINCNYGVSNELRPSSRIIDRVIATNPTASLSGTKSNGGKTFTHCVEISIKSKEDSTFYILNGDTIKYESPILIRTSDTIQFYSIRKGQKSKVEDILLFKIPSDKIVTINSKYNPQYSGGGDIAIVDGIRGEKNFRLGGWQGYQDTDFEVIIELINPLKVDSIGAGFLQDARSWIWMPKYVEFSISEDGINYSRKYKIETQVKEDDTEIQIWNPKVLMNEEDRNIKVRFIKVFAKNIGTIPSWHPGGGEAGFIFIDEISILPKEQLQLQ